MKRTFTQDERNIVFDLWKQEAGFSDIGHLTDLVTAISDLLYRFNLEFFCIAFATHNKYLLFTSIVTLSGIYNTRGLPLHHSPPSRLRQPQPRRKYYHISYSGVWRCRAEKLFCNALS